MRYILDTLKEDIYAMSTKEHLWYWIIPTVVLGTLMAFYFSGIPVLVEFVCPSTNWEWGILENMQLAIILGILGLAVYGFFKKENRLLEVGFGFLALFTLWVFLEEIDYGAHFRELFFGTRESYLRDLTGIKNLHNLNDGAKYWKRAVYIIMAVGFVIAPFFKDKINHSLLSFLIPKPKILIVAILSIAVDLVPRLLVKFQIFEDGGLGTNIGEFSEVVVYQIFLIYLYQLIFEKQTPEISWKL